MQRNNLSKIELLKVELFYNLILLTNDCIMTFLDIRGAYDKFPDVFRMGIYDRRRLLKMQYIIAIHFMRWLTNFYDSRFKWAATEGIGIHPTNCQSWWISKMQNDTLEELYEIEFSFKIERKNATKTYGILQTAFRPSCMNWASVFEWHKRFKEGRESVRDDEKCRRSKEVNTPELIGRRYRVRVTMLTF